jgi:hypothetical protein
MWKANNSWGETNDSFIFSFKYINGLFKDGIISNVKETTHAFFYGTCRRPSFGEDDLKLYGNNRAKIIIITIVNKIIMKKR